MGLRATAVGLSPQMLNSALPAPAIALLHWPSGLGHHGWLKAATYRSHWARKCPNTLGHLLYGNRRDNNAKRRTASAKPPVEALNIAAAVPPVAYLYLYRERPKDSPLHAIAISVWRGSEKILEVSPIHCGGLRNR